MAYWLLNRQFENENSQSLKRPDKCVQSETVVPLSPKNENKVKSNVSPWLATFTAIIPNGRIITSSGSSLKSCNLHERAWSWLTHATLPEWGSFNRNFNILQATQKSWVQHVKTIAGNLIPCQTVKMTIQIQHFAKSYGTKPSRLLGRF